MPRAPVLALVVLSACAAPRQSSGLLLGPHGEVTLEDTLPAFQKELGALASANDRPDLAWTRYEAVAADPLFLAGAQPDDPGDKLLFKACADVPALRTLIDGFEQAAPAELNALVSDFATRLGTSPDAIAVFAVARAFTPTFRGTRNGRALVLFNARSPELAPTEARRAFFARELFRATHERRVLDSPGQGPLAREVFRAGAASLAARQLVPQAPEAAVLGVEERQLPKLHGREAVLAKEMLASFDSASATEVARFFDRAVTDPLLPAGAGAYLADRIYQRIAAAEGSAQKPLRLSAAEFMPRARSALAHLAAGK